jgi:hypothetical protein
MARSSGRKSAPVMRGISDGRPCAESGDDQHDDENDEEELRNEDSSSDCEQQQE